MWNTVGGALESVLLPGSMIVQSSVVMERFGGERREGGDCEPTVAAIASTL